MLSEARNAGPRDIISGAGLTSLLFLAAGYAPILGIAAFVLLSPVMFYYRAKLGRPAAVVVLAAALGTALLRWGGLTPDVGLGAALLILGFALSEFAEKGLSIERTVLYACATVLAGGLAALMFYAGLSGAGTGAMVSDYIGEYLEISLRMYENAGMTGENLAVLTQAMESLHRLLVRVLPALATAFALVAAWMTLLTARAVMKRKGLAFPDFGPLNRWSAPDFLVWAVIGGGVLMLVPAEPAKAAAQNTLIVLATIYFFQGIAILSFLFESKGVPRPVRVAVYTMMAIWQLLALLVAGVGLFDTWVDFRRLRRAAETDSDDDENIF
ncbi:MAG: YybS family protein [Thermodesulfobacteriota bacterium]